MGENKTLGLKTHSHWDGQNIDQVSKDELYFRLYHDVITGYYNWNHMWKCLDKRLRPDDFRYCFVHFDIKDTRIVNKTYGHDATNNLLIAVCDKMEECKKEGWVYEAARCDNDNFAMMIKVMPEQEIVEKLNGMFESISFLPCDKNYSIFYRAGVVTAEDALLSDDRVADFAKIAQRTGKTFRQHDVNFYTSEMYRDFIHGNELLSNLTGALADDEFVVYFQPKFDLNTEKIVGAEALVRWYYKHEMMLCPADFIPIFESNSVIGKLDNVVLDKTCQVLAEMRNQGLELFPVSVNLSRSCVKDDNLIKTICATVDKYNIPHEKIEFELTETAAYTDIQGMFRVLKELRDNGFPVSMDDFGTGYSSLSLLKDMPMDTLKIDKSFIDSITHADSDSRENLLVRDIISMAKHLGFICLAEGAEKQEQIDFLRKAGCDKVQGYYYSKPVPVDQYISKVKAQG
ncbi:MAG: GGDEF domain-containing phosphodiesterase [Treponema sp.]|nr:GGDEF domain-containing phosphodiesterase [Treponema sp.]